MNYEKLAELRKKNLGGSAEIFKAGVELMNDIPNISKKIVAGKSTPVLASMESNIEKVLERKDNAPLFSLRMHPGKWEIPAIFIEKGSENVFRQVWDIDHDNYDIRGVNNISNVPYIYSFIKCFSLDKV